MITTKIYGLTAVGNTEYTGLAMSRNDVVITASSTDYAQPNFKYIFQVENMATGQILKFYQEQNLNNCASFNLKGIMMNVIQETINLSPTNDVITTPVELLTDVVYTNRLQIRAFSGWDIAGVFTEDSDYKRYDLMVLDGEGDDCYIPFGYGSNQTAGALVEKNENRMGWNAGGTYNVDLKDVRLTFRETANCTWFMVPRRRRWIGVPTYNDWELHYSSHYRSLVFVADDGTYVSDYYPYRNIGYIKIKFYDYDGTPIGTDLDIPFVVGAGSLFVLPTGLQNLEESGYLATAGITDTTIVKFWIVSFLDEAGTTSIFDNYGYYIEDECKHNEISLTWLNRFGGFESMGFVKRNERSMQTEKKRVMMIEGNYATATPEDFNIPYTSRTIKEKEPIKTQSITLNTGWINEEEFRRLKYLITSRSVWMEDSNFDGGKILPVVVETNNFTSRRERNNKKYNVTIEVRPAYSKRNLELFNTRNEGELNPLEIAPPPNPCIEGYATAKNGGASSLNLQNTYSSPVVIESVESVTKRFIQFGVEFTDGSTLQGGEYYCVRLDWDSGLPTDIQSSADMGEISVGNGAGAIDVYWSGDSWLMTTGWNTIYCSGINTSVRITLPTLLAKDTWTGTLTFYIKKVSAECPCGGY